MHKIHTFRVLSSGDQPALLVRVGKPLTFLPPGDCGADVDDGAAPMLKLKPPPEAFAGGV
jgi:hypothetical protein